MGLFKYVDGNLISLALAGEFDVIAHGCNCFCAQGAGIAVAMRDTFGTLSFPLEQLEDEDGNPTRNRGDINKLGQIDYQSFFIGGFKPFKVEEVYVLNHNVYSFETRQLDPEWVMIKDRLYVVNAYTQYNYGRNHADGDIAPVDLSAIVLCMKKINHIFKGKHIGLPKIGAGLAGGNWDTIEQLVKYQLRDCDVTIVNYVPNGE